ncbi:MAG TPA: phytanoyl-CoA dioxygenase family protein [Polyangiales bacterium]|nr:phytanoyl-CoA dioxygenase family protein [Polyangiales bacterium]
MTFPNLHVDADPGSALAAQLEALDRDGYVVLENLIDRERCALIREETHRLANKTGANPFEGHLTQRVYSPLSKTRAIDDLIDHPRVLALLDALFLPNYLLSQAQIINILPGEAAQALHHDDAFCAIPRPHRPIHAAFIAAIDDFTADNGATVVVPGSHRWSDRRPLREEAVPCVMPAGSAVFFVGSLWHGGGENRSDRSRLAVTGQYCEPWLRQHENFFLELSKEQARALREPIRSMIGYSIHPPFMGMVDRHHPRRALNL